MVHIQDFMMWTLHTMVDKILKTIEQYKMIKKGDTVAVCLSGGADSMALFHFLCFNKDFFGINVMALHVNHGLREESRQEEVFVKNYCNKLGAECIVYRANMNNNIKPQGLSTESWARELRYKFFFEQAEKCNAKLATAHTASDRCETVIFNITRGTSLKGASGIPPVRDNIIRPLINCTRSEIEKYCEENNIQYVTDKTNFDDVYSRNKIRLKVIPKLKQINPAVERAISIFADESQEIYTLLTQLSDNLYRKSVGEKGLSTVVLLKEHPAVVKNLIRNSLDELNCLSKDNVDAIFLALAQPRFRRQLSAKVFCEVKNGWLSFYKVEEKSETEPPQLVVEMDKIISFNHLNLIFSVVSYDEYKKIKENNKNYLTYCVRYDKIKNGLIIRTRQTGDTFTFGNRNVTKTLKKLFIEDKIPKEKRDEIVVLSDETNRVIWLDGYGVNKEYIPGPNCEKVLLIQQM